VESTVEVSIAEAFTGVAITGAYALEWRQASVLLRSVLLRSVPPPRVLITGQVIIRHGQ